MRIKLDENIPVSLEKELSGLGHDVDTVETEGLKGRDDPTIWAAAQREKRFLITQDLDFSDVRQYVPGTHFGLLLVRMTRPGRLAVVARLRSIFATEDIEGWSRCFVVATDHKIRVRRAPRT